MSKGTPRADLVVMFFFRLVDVHNEKLFRVRFEEDSEELVLASRLGHLAFFPWVQPEQLWFQFDLKHHDERVAANQLVFALAAKEGAGNMRNLSFMHDDGRRDPLTFGVPRSWEQIDRMPRNGVLKAFYTCSPEDR